MPLGYDGHKLKAIASDGEYFEPVEVDYIIIHAAKRNLYMTFYLKLITMTLTFGYVLRL